METDDSTKTKSNPTELESLSRFPWRVRVSAYNYVQDLSHSDEPNLNVKEVGTIFPSSSCLHGYDGIDLSGGFVTDSAGRTTWRLSDYVCKQIQSQLDLPVSFVATPLTDKPAYITVKFTALQSNPSNLIFEVYSWDHQGKPAPFTSFYWRCRIPLYSPWFLNELHGYNTRRGLGIVFWSVTKRNELK